MSVTDIRLALDFCDHRKTERMVMRLGEISVRCLLRLWMYAAGRRQLGVLDRMTPLDIADAAGWKHWQNPTLFPVNHDQFCAVLASEEIGYLDTLPDGQYAIHEWAEHQGWVSNAPQRRKKSQVANAAKYGVKLQQAELTFEVSIPSKPNIPSTPSPIPQDTAAEPSTPYGKTDSEESSNCVLGPPPLPLPPPPPLPLPSPLPRAAAPCAGAPLRGEKMVSVGAVLKPPVIWKTFVRILRFDLGWNEDEAEALMRAQRLKSEDPHYTDPVIVWPLAAAIYADRTKKPRNKYAFVSSCNKEPADCDQDQAKHYLSAALAQRGTETAARN